MNTNRQLYEAPCVHLVSVYTESAILVGSATIDNFSGEETEFNWSNV